ncbi:MAG: hypothetical protein AAF442_02320 [Pseudomonadota bacterium]
MKSLTSLHRLRQWEVDEIRRELGRLMTAQQNLEDQQEKLRQEIRREQQVVDQDHDRMLLSHNEYFDQAEERRKALRAGIEELRGHIDGQRRILEQQYRALKTAELLLEEHKKRTDKARLDAENRVLDEVGGRQHARQEAQTRKRSSRKPL